MTLAIKGLATCSKDGAASLNPMSFVDRSTDAIMERLRYQRSTGRFCDVLIVVKDRNFNAHRIVLAACSPYFDSILKSNKIVKEKVIVNCPNPTVFELILNYMYSGSVVIDRSIVTELLKMANNLLIVKLKNYCAEYLERYIDAANCLSVKELAVRYNLPELLKRTQEFLTAMSTDSTAQRSKTPETIRPDVHLNLIVRWVGHNLPVREQHFREMLQECPFQQVTQMRLERMLDYNPFFAQSESSLHIILQAMHDVGMAMEKYELKYRSLVQKNNIEKGIANPNYYNPNDMGDENGMSLEDPELMAEMHQHSLQSDALMDVNGQRGSRSDQLAAMKSNAAAQEHRPALKLKINLGASTEQVHKSSHKRRLLGMKLYRKSVASAGQHLIKRRGRPPKVKLPRMPVDFGAIDEEPESCFYDFNEDVHTIEIFDEPEDLNPNDLGELDSQSYLENSNMAGLEMTELCCEHCIYKANTVRQLRKHNAVAHSDNVLYVCNLCQFECQWNRFFYDHMRQHFPGPIFQCDSCAYTADRINVLLSHRLTHTDEKPYKCGQCDFRCRNKANLVTHCRVHSGEKPFKCSECNKGFSTRPAFQQHMNAHSEDRPFVCDQCDFATKYQSHLISHRRIHTGDLFRCEVEAVTTPHPRKPTSCPFANASGCALHQCRTCHRSFIEKSHLVRHERIHLVDKPFKCDSCDYASSRRDKLKEHILKHHDVSANSKQHRRRHRRARQLAQLAAQAKLLPPDPSNFFRPISTKSLTRRNKHFLNIYQKTIPVPAAAKYAYTAILPAASSSVSRQLWWFPLFFTPASPTLHGYCQPSQPALFSFFAHNNPAETSLSPSCFSLHDFHHNAGDFNFNHTSTPDTDLSTPGPQLDRNPHSVSNIYSGGGGRHPHFGHQMVDSSQTNDPQMQDPQRPMSLPNYGNVLQQQQTLPPQMFLDGSTAGVPAAHPQTSSQHQHQTAWTIHGSQMFP
uniref:Uncharacterized protein n=1 Tax=Ditylenchus dipsaci TaxID=166011 RepID=A0A915D076_9BILA